MFAKKKKWKYVMGVWALLSGMISNNFDKISD